MLKITPSTSNEKSNLFIETLLNYTDKVSKVSPNSTLSGIGQGIGKISMKTEKDLIVSISQLFPDNSFDTVLDECARNYGVGPRLGSLGSSTYVRLTGVPGTNYQSTGTTLTSTSGVVFSLQNDVTLGSEGFAYVKVVSTTQGNSTNVEPLSITRISPQPPGHQSVVNEYMSEGGRDQESDEIFRKRIKESFNLFATGTLKKIELIFSIINPKVLKVYNRGRQMDGKVTVGVSTQDGSLLSQSEIDSLKELSAPYLNLSDLQSYGRGGYRGVNIENQEDFTFDVSFRCIPELGYNIDEVRRQIQVSISKKYDFRTFNPFNDKIEWDDILDIVKRNPGIKYTYDSDFVPRADISVPWDKVPRLRSFLILDKNGAVLSNSGSSLSPVYYPNVVDEEYYKTLIQI